MEVKYKRKKLTVNELVQRNKKILIDFNKGERRLEIAKKYNLTLTQIYNIIRNFAQNQ